MKDEIIFGNGQNHSLILAIRKKPYQHIRLPSSKTELSNVVVQ